MKRVLLIGAGLIILLLVIAGGATYWFLSGDGIRRALEQQATAWLGHPVQIGSARAQFYPRIGIRLGDVRAGDPVHATLQTVEISAALRPLLNRRIEEATVTLANSRIDLPLPFSIPTGEGDANPSDSADSGGGDGPASSAGQSAVQLVSIQAVTLRNIVIASRGREVTVSADSALAGSRLTLQRVTASSGKTELTAFGTVDLAPRMDANLTVKANRLDVDELLALAAAFSSPPSRSTARVEGAAKTPAAHVVATIDADTARASDLEVRQFATTIDSDGERVSLDPLSFELFGGRYDGSIVASLTRTMSATIRSTVTNLDVARLAAYGGSPDTVSGRLTGSGTFTGQGSDVETALATARGSGAATMTDGVIKRLDLVRTVVLFFGRPAPDAGASSDRYDRIDLKFSLANQAFRADAFALRSLDFDLTGTATLALRSKALGGAFNLMLSEKLSAQAGTDLVRFTREGNRVVLPARLGGSLDQPRVTIDAKAALERGIKNEAERRLKGLLDDFLKQR